MSITIRTATQDEVDAIRRMHAACWLDTYPNDEHGVPYAWVKSVTDEWLSPEKLELSKQHFTNVFNSRDHFYRVAVDNSKIAGFVHGLKEDGKTKLGALYLAKEYYGTGLAQQLAALADEWLGDDAVELEVVAYNKRAIRFYEKWGFKKVEGSDALFKDKIPDFTMRREAKV